MLRALRRLLPYVRLVRRSIGIGLVCVLLTTAISLVSPWVLRYVIDDLNSGFTRTRLGGYALLLLGLAVGEGWFRYLMRQRIIGASREIEYRLRNDFFARLERLPLSYFQANRTGDLMSRATNDLNAVRMMIGPAVMYFANTTLGFVIAVLLMFKIDTRLTLLALLPLPGVTLATRYFGQAIHDRFERIQSQLADMSAVIQESLAGVRVVRAYRQEPAEIARFRHSNDQYVARNRRLITLQAAFYPSLTFCFGLSTLIVVWVGGRDVIARRLTLGEFVAFSRYLVMLSWPMIAFGWVINIVQRGVASWERMLEVMDAEGGAEVRPSTSDLRTSTSTAPRIEVRDLTFRYPGAVANALEDISFVAEPGQTVALVGATGSGKSTLISLLPCLQEPPRGTIFVGGIDVRDLPPGELRRTIGVVPQEPFLFSDTVGGNIAFGLGGPADSAETHARVTRAAELAGLASDVAAFPGGYDTRVGERGITLSGGQKQRAALARAIAIDPRILVLDDALSSVDTATEETILRELTAVRRARTCLIVAHRISTVRDADQILVLRDGRIAERGTHDELVGRGGLYADMHRRQLLEEEIAATP
jgi:ATP-binding cassette subfamily B multidrug efflux pump